MFQLMINWWFGARWFGILGVPLSNYPFHNSIIGIHRAPNHQFTTTTTTTTRIYTYKLLGTQMTFVLLGILLTLLKVVKGKVPDLQLNIHPVVPLPMHLQGLISEVGKLRSWSQEAAVRFILRNEFNECLGREDSPRNPRRWFTQRFLEFSPRKLGKVNPIWRAYFSSWVETTN